MVAVDSLERLGHLEINHMYSIPSREIKITLMKDQGKGTNPLGTIMRILLRKSPTWQKKIDLIDGKQTGPEV